MQIHFYSHHHPLSSSSSSTVFFIPPPFKPQSPKPHKKPSLILSSNKINPNPSSNNSSSSLKHSEPLELLTKPEKPKSDRIPSEEPQKPSEEFAEALAPFLKFFKSNGEDLDSEDDSDFAPTQQPINAVAELGVTAGVKYYDPKRGDLVMGVVVSGNENKLDVNVGADLLGTMLTKEVMPLYNAEIDYLLCDVKREKEREEFMVRGKMGIVRDEEVLKRDKVDGRPVVEVGTVVFAEVLGRTLSGRPLLSSRRMYRRVAWHRVR